MQLTRELIDAYNETRETAARDLLCHFPWTTLNFDQRGRATACCYNRTHVLGTYPDDSIEEMWFGEPAEELRGHLAGNDLSHGCGLCHAQLVSRNFHGTRARAADIYAIPDQAATWSEARAKGMPYPPAVMPRAFEFELQNTCNLECIMCNGQFSSSIRRRRENLPPLRSPYDADFVRQLDAFLPHLKVARFLGGEPLLIEIYYAIWERIIALNPSLEVAVTTNATTVRERAKRMLERLNCHIAISIDSIVPETYERIRVNADHAEVMRNVEWLQALVREKGRSLSFAVCPMRLNWHEMSALVSWCTERDVSVFFNTVLWPLDLSLRTLPATELEAIVRELSAFDFTATTELERRNRGVWLSFVSQVRTWLEDRRAEERGEVLPPAVHGQAAPVRAPAQQAHAPVDTPVLVQLTAAEPASPVLEQETHPGPQAAPGGESDPEEASGRDGRRRMHEILSRTVASRPPGSLGPLGGLLLDHLRAALAPDATPSSPATELARLRAQFDSMPAEQALTRYFELLTIVHPYVSDDWSTITRFAANARLLIGFVDRIGRVDDFYSEAVLGATPIEIIEALREMGEADVEATIEARYGLAAAES